MATRKKTIGGVDRWEVESALDTLIRAEELKTDKKMMKAVKTESKRRQKALSKVVRKKR